MASLCRQVIRVSALRNVIATIPRRTYADKMLADPIEHATGLEKKEILAMKAGDDDPFAMKVIKRGKSSKDNPTLVPSCFDARIVGCICEEHATSINWFWLHKGQQRRCDCGSWYKLVDKQPL